MSYFTIDTYEKVATTLVRPSHEAQVLQSGELRVVEADIASLPRESAQTVLSVRADRSDDPAAAEAHVRHIGALCDGGRGFAGVVMDGVSGVYTTALIRAFVQAFDNTALLVRLPDDARLADRMRREGYTFGLLLDARCGLIALRRALASFRLQRIWQTAPVYMINTAEVETGALSAALGWHVAKADIAGICQPRLQLRRLTYPKQLSSGGAFPLRFWWHNPSTAPLYGGSMVRLMLRGCGGDYFIDTKDAACVRPVGDGVYNEIARLCQLETGEYELWCGLFSEDGPLALAISAECENGFYKVGTISIDGTPRPELFNIWDDYYPEGYYPLEDPKLPY